MSAARETTRVGFETRLHEAALDTVRELLGRVLAIGEVIGEKT